MGSFAMSLRGLVGIGLAAGAVLLLLVSMSSAQDARPLRGVAMVIGNSEYEHLSALANPANDARAVEMLLADLGFETELSSDRDARRLARDLDIFLEDAEGADVAIVYYAGHGIEAGGENFLVPVDADPSALDEAAEKLVPLSDFIERLQATVPVAIVMLDACRDNPFPPGAMVRLDEDSEPVPMGEGGLGETRGARSLAAPAPDVENFGTVIAFAAEPGRPALDGTPGGNSPYTAAVLRHLETMAGEEFGTVMRMVAEEVYLKTAGQQRPWINESLRRLLYFGAAPEPVAGVEGEILSERRQLLITISALPVQGRQLVERAAADGGVPMDALFAMLDTLGEDLPDDPAELDRLLRRLADDLKRVLDERKVITTTDPEIVRLSELAQRATDEGALATAVRLYEQAKARIGELESTVADAEAELRQRRIEFAEVYARSAQTRALALDHIGAAADFEQAAQQLVQWDREQEARYRLAQARALVDHGTIRGHTPSLAEAVTLLAALERQGSEDAGFALSVRIAHADALAELGRRETANASLESAVELYRAVLAEQASASDAERAATQRKLAATLLALGRRDIDRTRLLAAADAISAAIELEPRETSPVAWGSAQASLGQIRLELWERERDGIDPLDEAIGHYREAVAVLRDQAPDEWVSAQLGLGRALRLRGIWNFTNPGYNYTEALSVYDAVIEHCARDTYPVCWAAASHGKAVALHLLGRTVSDESEVFSLFRQSMAAFQDALSEQRLDMAPADWAETYASRAEMLSRFALVSADGIKLIYRAEAAQGYRRALEVITPETFPALWFELNDKIAEVYGVLAVSDSREGAESRYLDLQTSHLRSALDGLRKSDDLELWAFHHGDLGQNLTKRLQIEPSEELYREAIAQYDEARSTLTEMGEPERMASYADRHAYTVLGYGVFKGDAAAIHEARSLIEQYSDEIGTKMPDYLQRRLMAFLDEAATALRELGHEALREEADRLRSLKDAGDGETAAQARYDLAATLLALDALGGDPALVDEAIAAYRSALEAWTADAAPARHVRVSEALGDLLQRAAGGDRDRLLEAAAAYEDAVGLLDFESSGDERARVERKLADLLGFSIGKPFNDQEALERAIGHYRSLATYQTAETASGAFAGIQHGIGECALAIGYATGDAARYAEAAEAYRLAKTVVTPDSDGPWWTQNEDQLAAAVLAQGEALSDADLYREAIEHYEAAIDMRRQLEEPVATAFTLSNLARARYLLGSALEDKAVLEAAAVEMRQAMDVLGRDEYPKSWAWTNINLGHILTDIAKLDGSRIDEAIEAFGEALALRPHETHAWDWAIATHNTAYLYRLKGDGSDDVADYRRVVELSRAVIPVHRENGAPYYAALAELLLCQAYTGIAEASGDPVAAAQAVEACQRGMPDVRSGGDEEDIAEAEKAMAAARKALAQIR